MSDPTTPRQRGSPSAAQVTAAVRHVLQSVPASVQTQFVETVAVDHNTDLDGLLWGAAPSASEQRTAALQALKNDFVDRMAVLNASLIHAEVATLLGVSTQAVLDWLESGELIGLKQGRQWRIPMWQINPDAERGFLPGLAELRPVFPGGVVSLTRWATTPNGELGELTPADALATGRIDDVIAVTVGSTAAAW